MNHSVDANSARYFNQIVPQRRKDDGSSCEMAKWVRFATSLDTHLAVARKEAKLEHFGV